MSLVFNLAFDVRDDGACLIFFLFLSRFLRAAHFPCMH